MQYKLHVASGLNIPWNGSMKWKMEENFSMEWKKLASMEYEKIVFYSIPYHALLRETWPLIIVEHVLLNPVSFMTKNSKANIRVIIYC